MAIIKVRKQSFNREKDYWHCVCVYVNDRPIGRPSPSQFSFSSLFSHALPLMMHTSSLRCSLWLLSLLFYSLILQFICSCLLIWSEEKQRKREQQNLQLMISGGNCCRRICTSAKQASNRHSQGCPLQFAFLHCHCQLHQFATRIELSPWTTTHQLE